MDRIRNHSEALALISRIEKLPKLEPVKADTEARDVRKKINRVGIELLRHDGNPAMLKALSDGASLADVTLGENLFTIATKRILRPKSLGPVTIAGFRSWKYRVPPDYYQDADTPIDSHGQITDLQVFEDDLYHKGFDGLAVCEVNDMLTLIIRPNEDQPVIDINNLSLGNANLIAAHHPWTLGEDPDELQTKIEGVKRPGDLETIRKRKAFGYWWALAQMHAERLQYLTRDGKVLPPQTFSTLAQEQGEHRLNEMGVLPVLDFLGQPLSLDDARGTIEHLTKNLSDIVETITQNPPQNGRNQILNVGTSMGYDLVGEPISRD